MGIFNIRSTIKRRFEIEAETEDLAKERDNLLISVESLKTRIKELEYSILKIREVKLVELEELCDIRKEESSLKSSIQELINQREILKHEIKALGG